MPEELPNLDTTPRRSPTEDFYGTLYPYIDYKGGIVGSVLNPIRRLIYPINPFASQQVESRDSYGIGDRFGNGFYHQPKYVTGQVFSNLFPNHFDPSTDDHPDKKGSDPNLYGDKPGPAMTGKLATFSETLPRGCYRAKQAYERCKMINTKENCSNEGQNILGVCPNWALLEMRGDKRFRNKVMLIQREEYAQAMGVADYNSGRSVADISSKTHIHGTRQYLRPDTLWADERYRSVTKEEIIAAKQRHEGRLKTQGRFNAPLNEAVHTHDNTGAQEKVPKELY